MEIYNLLQYKVHRCIKKKKKEKITICHKYISKPYLIFSSSKRKTSFISCLVKIIKFY